MTLAKVYSILAEKLQYLDLYQLAVTCKAFHYLPSDLQLLVRNKKRRDPNFFQWLLNKIRSKLSLNPYQSESVIDFPTSKLLYENCTRWITLLDNIEKDRNNIKIHNYLSQPYEILHLIDRVIRGLEPPDRIEELELFLYRYYCQLKFVLKGKEIKDPLAKEFWNNNFYKRNWVTVEEILTALHVNGILANKKQVKSFHPILNYLLNFPRDDQITQYKFHILVCIFGPWSNLIENISFICDQTGFFGFINRNTAADYFKKHMEEARHLFRFSRSDPKNLVLTYIYQGKICHLKLLPQANYPLLEDLLPKYIKPYSSPLNYHVDYGELAVVQLDEYIRSKIVYIVSKKEN